MCAFRFSLVLLLTLLAASPRLGAATKDGLTVTVSNTTVDRNDQRPGYYYSPRNDRIEALKVSLKNGSFKPMPAGEIRWEILVRKYYSTSVEMMSGTEKLQALRPAEGIDVVIGGAQVQGWRDGTLQSKDKLEWQVTVFQDGKEVLKTNSTAGFDALAKRATKVDPPK